MAKKHKFLIAKLAVFVVMAVGFSLLIPGGKVSAINCPAKYDTSIPSNWGIQSNGLDNHFATVAVYAYNSRTNEPLNVKYRLNSSVDPNFNYGPAPVGEDGTKVPSSLWPDARIFQIHLSGNTIKADARWKQKWFETGGTLNSPPGACDGWDELGPGTNTYQGNGFALDCQEVGTDGNKHNNRFWIDQITKPSGSDGVWGGHWTIKASSGGEDLTDRGYPMDGTSSWLSVINGQNARIHLIWHPNDPPGDPPPDEPACSYLKVYGGGQYKIDTDGDGTIDKSWDTDTYVRVTQGHGPNDSFTETGTLVQGDGGDLYNHIGTDATSYKEWTYKPKDLRIAVHVIRKYHHKNGDDWVDTEYQNTTNYFTCYDASCTVNVNGNVAGRSNGVQSRSVFSVDTDIYNNAGPPESTKLFGALGDGSSQPLLLTTTSSPVGFSYAPGQVPRKSHNYNTFYPAEPGGSIGSYEINARLFYDLDNNGYGGNDLVLADCSSASPVVNTKVYDVYKEFHIQPHAEVYLEDSAGNPSPEDPDRVRYSGTTSGNVPDYPGGIDVNYAANGRGTLFAGGTQCIDVRSSVGHTSNVYSHTCPLPSNHAGDRYDLDFCVSQTDGWIGPGYRFSSDTYGSCASNFSLVYDRPYLRTFGADVISGSNFKNGDTCDTTGNAQAISAYRSTTPGKSGSGAQFAALALAQISGFRSASTMPGAGATALSFANTVGTGGGGLDQPNDGGFYAGSAICAQDFYGTWQKNPITSGASSVNINTSGQIQDVKQTLFNLNGADLTVTSNGSNFDKQSVIFVDGNVIIRNNIKFNPGKYLAIVAKGNIYIDKSVTRLDGIYIAQPRNATTGGTIVTCANGTNPISTNSLYGSSNCGNQLVINGAFAAKDVRFLRTAHSLRDSRVREAPTDFSDGSGTNAAEVFNFSPEFYLYTPIFEEVTTGQPYQYITTLPPVL